MDNKFNRKSGKGSRGLGFTNLLQVKVLKAYSRESRLRPVKTVLVLSLLAAFLGGAASHVGKFLGNSPPTKIIETPEMVNSEDGSILTTGYKLLPDKKLPDRPPAASGQFNNRVDNSLFIHVFPASGMVILDNVDEYALLEVVITRKTLIFKDVTEFSGTYHDGVVQQTVIIGHADEIAKGTSVFVWGEKHGDRIIAEVLQYF